MNKSFVGFNALKAYVTKPLPQKDVAMLLYAAGEEVESGAFSKVPKFLQFRELKMNLKHMCRQTIRKHLLKLDQHQHLFDRVPRLGLPPTLNRYLLFDVSLETDDQVKEDSDDDNGNDEDNIDPKTKSSRNQCETQ